MDFWGVHYGHKGDAAMKLEALSSARQIVNERLMKCVQPAQKKQSRAHAFQAT
jgi:cellobiose-specific phosphotransferase system component IIA